MSGFDQNCIITVRPHDGGTNMAHVIPYLQQILYVLLVTSAATLLLFLLSVLLRSGPRVSSMISIAKPIAAITSLGTFIIALLNLSVPIGVIPPPDKAEQTIHEFYRAIQDRNFDTAYVLVHPARLDEIRKTRPHFDRGQFSETYATTRNYRNRSVCLLSSGEDKTGRLYAVTFDVSDEVPRNRLYELQQDLVKDISARGFLNLESLLSFIMENLREYYEVPRSAEPVIRDFIVNRQFSTLIDPVLLSEIRRSLSHDYQIEIKERQIKPSTSVVWRHFSQRLVLSRETENWKIRQGLADPRAVANYPPPSSP
jgi:hypothetical protein